VVELAGQVGIKGAQIKAWTRLARVLAFQDPEQCIAVCERAVDASRAHDDPLLQARAEMLLACWRIITNGWNAADAERCQAALAKVRSISAELPAYYEILYAHVQCVQGDYEGACRTATAGIPKSLENNSLVVFLSAHSSLAYGLLHLGRWGELLQVVSAALSTAEKNGNAPWIGIFQASLGWLRIQAADFAGASCLAEDLLLKNTEEPAGQVRTMATIVKGYALMAHQDPGQASECFGKVCGREMDPRFFLDWYWRIVGRLGLSEACLAKGELTLAAEQSDLALDSALSTPDPALKALAWTMKARIAMAGQDWQQAEQCLKSAFAALAAGNVPSAAWRVHAAAAELHRRNGNKTLERQSRSDAAETLRLLAYSFREGADLRETLLAAAHANE
jgi:tetratricopeptide (TPR) repeat protein